MQLPSVRIAKRKGWKAFVAARDIDPAIRRLADETVEVDLRDLERVTAAAQELRARHGLDGVFTAGTDFSTTVAWVASELRLPGIPYAVAVNATDKARMRVRFRAKGVPCPSFVTVEKGRTWEPPAGFSFPLVVKPVDNMGARGVRRVDTEEELSGAVATAMAQSRSGKVIVEQFMEGPELSLDAVVYRGKATVCGVADRHIFFPPYFVEMGHTMPSALEPRILEQAEEVFKRGISALGIRNGAAKGDIKITPQGPAIGEVAARLSGGYMSGWTFPLSSGIEVTEAALNIAAGLPPGDLTPRFKAVSAERAFISIPGRVASIEGITEVRAIAGMEELFLRIRTGDRVKLPVNNLEKCGNAITRAPERCRAVEAVEQAIQRIFLRLKPADEETERFLLDRNPGPWVAFPSIPQSLARWLAEQPDAVGSPGTLAHGSPSLAVLRPEGLEAEPARDWHGFSLARALDRVRGLTGVPLVASPQPGKLTLGRIFWNVFLWGSVQAGVYLLETLAAEDPRAVLQRFRKAAK